MDEVMTFAQWYDSHEEWWKDHRDTFEQVWNALRENRSPEATASLMDDFVYAMRDQYGD